MKNLKYREKPSIWGRKLIVKEKSKIFPKKGKAYYKIFEEKGIKIGYLDQLTIGLLSRKRGLGTSITKEVIRRMKKEGVKKVRAEIKSSNPEVMEKIFEREGFKLVGYKERNIPITDNTGMGIHLIEKIKSPIYELEL